MSRELLSSIVSALDLPTVRFSLSLPIKSSTIVQYTQFYTQYDSSSFIYTVYCTVVRLLGHAMPIKSSTIVQYLLNSFIQL